MSDKLFPILIVYNILGKHGNVAQSRTIYAVPCQDKGIMRFDQDQGSNLTLISVKGNAIVYLKCSLYGVQLFVSSHTLAKSCW